jgi:Fe-S-cluster containining protein
MIRRSVSKRSKLAGLYARLDAVYARLPTIECRRRCAIACGPILATDLEARRLQATTHVKPRTVLRVLADGPPSTAHERERCIYLHNERDCSAYAVRPLICRVFGLVRQLSCPHGCIPSSWLTDLEFVAIAREVERLDGSRLLRTTPAGLALEPRGFLDLPVEQSIRTPEQLAAHAERVRNLRALHGGRIVAALKEDADGQPAD